MLKCPKPKQKKVENKQNKIKTLFRVVESKDLVFIISNGNVIPSLCVFVCASFGLCSNCLLFRSCGICMKLTIRLFILCQCVCSPTPVFHSVEHCNSLWARLFSFICYYIQPSFNIINLHSFKYIDCIGNFMCENVKVLSYCEEAARNVWCECKKIESGLKLPNKIQLSMFFFTSSRQLN